MTEAGRSRLVLVGPDEIGSQAQQGPEESVVALKFVDGRVEYATEV